VSVETEDRLTLRRVVIWWICWAIWAIGPRTFFRQRPRNADRLPKEGPYLLLANHTSFFDPAWIAFHAWRPANFMASAQLFRVPILGPLVAALGAFPKTKFVKDRGSMATLQRRYELGQVITLFPEGERTWDGRQLEILPCIARLIKRLDARVVYGRIQTGHINQPRWAAYPRFVPIHLEYDGPYTYPADMPDEELVAEVRRRLKVDPLPPLPPFSFGWRTAYGLPAFLWACPACLTLDALQVDRRNSNAVTCVACGSSWRVALDNRLRPRRGNARPMTIPEAFDRLQESFGKPPVADPGDFEAEGVVLRCERMRVLEVLKGEREPRPIVEGSARLTMEALEIHGEGEWSVALTEVRAVSTELTNKLQLRLADRLLQLEPVGQSTLKWNYVLKPWRQRAWNRAQ
jgi:1-acyl-sn-glycerol-3-phosphate acyltransferase